jgi:hypothetical protein
MKLEDVSERTPTPVGWSDTDWIKHIADQRKHEQEQPHPMSCLHINQGSLDAAADAYEAEYNKAHGVEELTWITQTLLTNRRAISASPCSAPGYSRSHCGDR